MLLRPYSRGIMAKIFTALTKEERVSRRGNLRLKFEVFMEKIFTALNKELAKFFPLSFDYLLTFRTLKVQCFQGVSASAGEGVGIYVPPPLHHAFYAL